MPGFVPGLGVAFRRGPMRPGFGSCASLHRSRPSWLGLDHRARTCTKRLTIDFDDVAPLLLHNEAKSNILACRCENVRLVG
jgi:hypothetical protein